MYNIIIENTNENSKDTKLGYEVISLSNSIYIDYRENIKNFNQLNETIKGLKKELPNNRYIKILNKKGKTLESSYIIKEREDGLKKINEIVNKREEKRNEIDGLVNIRQKKLRIKDFKSNEISLDGIKLTQKYFYSFSNDIKGINKLVRENRKQIKYKRRLLTDCKENEKEQITKGINEIISQQKELGKLIDENVMRRKAVIMALKTLDLIK